MVTIFSRTFFLKRTWQDAKNLCGVSGMALIDDKDENINALKHIEDLWKTVPKLASLYFWSATKTT